MVGLLPLSHFQREKRLDEEKCAQRHDSGGGGGILFFLHMQISPCVSVALLFACIFDGQVGFCNVLDASLNLCTQRRSRRNKFAPTHNRSIDRVRVRGK